MGESTSRKSFANKLRAGLSQSGAAPIVSASSRAIEKDGLVEDL